MMYVSIFFIVFVLCNAEIDERNVGQKRILLHSDDDVAAMLETLTQKVSKHLTTEPTHSPVKAALFPICVVYVSVWSKVKLGSDCQIVNTTGVAPISIVGRAYT